MGFCSYDCKDSEYTCTAWDGTGRNKIDNITPNHNLVKECPKDITKCEYRKKKIASKPF